MTDTANNPQPMLPRWFAPVFIVVVLGFAASLLLLLTFIGGKAAETSNDTTAALYAPTPGLESLSIPDFDLVDQAGDPVNESVFEDRFTLVSFVFTNCVLVCPDLTGAMLDLHLHFANSPVSFVSMSVDPENDTPEVLAAYAERYGVESSRWKFLTGEPGEVERVVTDGLKFELAPDPSEANQIQLPGGSVMANIIHPSSILLVGPDRQVLGRYRYQFPSEIEELKKRLGSIMAIERGR